MSDNNCIDEISCSSIDDNLFFSTSLNSNNLKRITKLSFVLQNIRSMRTNFDVFLTELNVFDELPMFIFLTETFIYDDEIVNYKIDNYTSYANCNNSYKSGGVIAYAKSNLKCEVSTESFTSCDLIKISTYVNNENLTFVCIYRFHRCTIDKFLNDMNGYLNKIKCKNLIVLGDININLLNGSISQNYLYDMSSFGLTSNINTATRPSSGSCIDHVFSRLSPSFNLLCNVLEYYITDHSLIHCEIKFLMNECNQNSIKKRSKNVLDMPELIKSLDQEDWGNVYSETDPNLAYNDFIKILKSYLNAHTKCVILKRKDMKIKPWMSYELIEKINCKKKVYKKLKKHPDNVEVKKHFKMISKEIKVLVAKTKEEYYLSKFDEVGCDMKKSWQLVDEITSYSSKRIESTNMLIINGNTITDSYDIAENFNNYFVNIASELRENNVIPDDFHYSHHIDKSCYLNPITAHELCMIVASMQNKSSKDIDGLSNVIVKSTFIYIVDVLSHIFNLSFSSGIVPDNLKQAVVIPLHKNGNMNRIENFRPISLLSIFSKILEKAMKNRIMNFLDSVSFISNCQFGFRENLSTEDALQTFLNSVYNSLNDDKKCAALFIDIKKAFDMVDHALLLEILHNIGIRGVVLNWFESYLSNRLQCVKFRDGLSSFKSVDIGVPQGSVLGPLLFLIYINSIFELNLNGSMVGFADDMALVYTCTNEGGIVDEMNADLRLLSKWFHYHGLILSEKTKAMFFQISGNQSTDKSLLLYHSYNCIGNQCSSCLKINWVHEFKYLGICVDSNLNWKLHINKLSKYMCYILQKFYLLRNVCPVRVMNSVYYALVQSKLQYGITCWGGAYYSTIKPLVMLQKHTIRIISHKSRLSSAWPIFLENRILPLRHLYIYKVLKLFYKRSGNRSFKYTEMYNVRSNNRLLCNVPRSNKEYFRHYYLYTSTVLFNQLPISIRLSEKLTAFLNEVKKWLFQIPIPENLFQHLA